MIPSGCRVPSPVTSPTSMAFPKRFSGSASPRCPHKETLCGMSFEIVAIPYVQASWFVRHPGLPCRCAPAASQDSRDFYTRADHASSPMHASGMLAVSYRQLTAEGLSPSQTRSHVGRYQPLSSSGSHQANTPVIPISQCTKRPFRSAASRCRNWLARTLWSLKRLNFRIAQTTSV